MRSAIREYGLLPAEGHVYRAAETATDRMRSVGAGISNTFNFFARGWRASIGRSAEDSTFVFGCSNTKESKTFTSRSFSFFERMLNSAAFFILRFTF